MIRSLLILVVLSFVISSVCPYVSQQTPTVNLEETDMDSQESSEEHKEKEENKESIRHDLLCAVLLTFKLDSVLSKKEHTPVLKELYLPVLTPPPDTTTGTC